MNRRERTAVKCMDRLFGILTEGCGDEYEIATGYDGGEYSAVFWGQYIEEAEEKAAAIVSRRFDIPVWKLYDLRDEAAQDWAHGFYDAMERRARGGPLEVVQRRVGGTRAEREDRQGEEQTDDGRSSAHERDPPKARRA